MSQQKNVIVIIEDNPDQQLEQRMSGTYGTLTEACDLNGWSYNYLKKMKFPFRYQGKVFMKIAYRAIMQTPE